MLGGLGVILVELFDLGEVDGYRFCYKNESVFL